MAYTYDAADGQKPNHHGHNVLEPRSILSVLSMGIHLPQKFETDIKIEDGADADRTEESNKKSSPSLVNLFDMHMHCVDDRYPAQ